MYRRDSRYLLPWLDSMCFVVTVNDGRGNLRLDATGSTHPVVTVDDGRREL